MPSPILARADALIQRHRPRSGTTEDVPVLTDSDEQRIRPETPVDSAHTPTKPPLPITDFGTKNPPAENVPLDFDPPIPEPDIDDDIPVLFDAEPADIDLPPPLFPPAPKKAAPNGLFAQLHAALDRESSDETTSIRNNAHQHTEPDSFISPTHASPGRSSSPEPLGIVQNSMDESQLHELCQRIEARLAIVLPRLIEEVLDDYLQERQVRHHD
jgi:hypothetical protein